MAFKLQLTLRSSKHYFFKVIFILILKKCLTMNPVKPLIKHKPILIYSFKVWGGGQGILVSS